MLAVLLRNGATWVRWPIVVWCPVTIVGGMTWAHTRGVGAFDAIEFFVVAVPLMIAWVWFVGHTLFKRATPKT